MKIEVKQKAELKESEDNMSVKLSKFMVLGIVITLIVSLSVICAAEIYAANMPAPNDLIIKSLAVNKEAPVLGEDVEIKALVRNASMPLGQGNPSMQLEKSVVTIVKVKFRIGNKILEIRRHGMPANSEKEFVCIFKPDHLGKQIITAMVDPDNDMPELNENNNTAHKQIEVFVLDKSQKALPPLLQDNKQIQ